MDYTHAYFTLPAFLFMVWYKRAELKALVTSNPVFSVYSVCLLIVGLDLFVLGWRKDFLLVSTFSLIPVIAGLTGYLYGPKVLKALAFPILYLLFMVPPPLGILDAITLPLRYITSEIAVFILQCLFVPVRQEGLLLFFGQHEVFMAPACSGFRSLITFLSLAMLYVYFIKASMKKKILLILSVFPLAFIGNLARVLLLCLITYYLGPEAGQSFLHDASGIMVFLIIVSGFMLIDKLYEDDES